MIFPPSLIILSIRNKESFEITGPIFVFKEYGSPIIKLKIFFFKEYKNFSEIDLWIINLFFPEVYLEFSSIIFQTNLFKVLFPKHYQLKYQNSF